ncbi:MAG: glutaminyl-peptide cyclotransferase, partial [Chloroflexi bacterium]|nr:glutaminyl-peptide cyclotransferase [Chloroflexota bacterium]
MPSPTRGTVAPVASYRVIAVYPHDRDAFTQGLVYLDDFLYESTGLYGRATLRKVDLASGRVLQMASLLPEYFGEGIAVWGERIVQLTWREEIGFLYDRTSFAQVGAFHYPGEGWGLTHDGVSLIMSDGTAALRFLDPDTLRETGRLQVHDGGRP